MIFSLLNGNHTEREILHMSAYYCIPLVIQLRNLTLYRFAGDSTQMTWTRLSHMLDE